MDDDNVLRRWFSLELGNLLETFVASPRPLLDLLREPTPAATTRSGLPHPFDRDALHQFAKSLPPLTRAQVRLPLTIHLDHETPGDAYAADPAAIEAIRALVPTTSPPRDGRLWLSEPLAREFARRFPTLVQFVVR